MKKILFVMSLLLGISLIIIIPYLLFEVDNVVLYISLISLYTSSTTAIYSILAEPNPNKAKKQELYGQLRKSILVIISRLEGRYYQDIHFGLWKGIRQDDRYFLFDEDLRGKLDVFLEKIKKYSATIIELDSTIIPEIIDNSIVTVFDVDRSSFGNITIYAHVNIKKRPRFQTSISELGYCLKKQTSLIDVIHHKAKTNGIDFEEIESIQMVLPLSSYDLTDDKKITTFWNKCLTKIKNVPKHKFVVEENEELLEEANEIKDELNKRIKKTIAS